MIKTVIRISFLFSSFIALALTGFAFTQTFEVGKKDIHNGYFIRKIWLEVYSKPAVTVTGLVYSENIALPAGAKVGDPHNVQVIQGMERKRPFIIVSIPAYSKGNTDGQVNQLSGCTIHFDEVHASAARMSASRYADTTNSVLSTGTWYKIGITKTGFYRLDYNFFTSLGINAGNINPDDIRVFGNGGHMLSENNAVPRPADLIENAILVNDGGDHVFNSGDYAVFYAVGPTAWFTDSISQAFTHQNNLYTDTAYYFITVTNGAGKRIATQSTPAPAPNVTCTGFNYYDVHELDLVNPSTYGKTWYGEAFSDQLGDALNINFDLGDVASELSCNLSFACIQGNANSVMNTTLGGITLPSAVFTSPIVTDVLIFHVNTSWTGSYNSRYANFSLNFVPSAPTSTLSSTGYLHYIEVNARRPLSFAGAGQFSFRDWQTTGIGKIAGYSLQGANNATTVWDVTNPQVPVLMSGSLKGSLYSFSQDAGSLHEFAASDGSTFYTPTYISQVANQNLHATPLVDLIVVAYPGFLDQAKQLAAFHQSNDGLTTVVATTDQVYNEFSSGGQDISAIRDFVRMLYSRATDSAQMPKYLLLYGDGANDYKNRVTGNCNFVPTYETANDSSDLDGFSSDDFYGFLDDSEYIENININNALDIGVGRIPARSITDATVAVNKILDYKSAKALGPWRVASMFVAEKCDDAGCHLEDAETMSSTLKTASANLYNEQKVYVDAIPIISTPGGPRCPNANAAINDQIYQGVFMVNYNGHGNPQVWANERILSQDDFSNWNNAYSLPFMTTATCDFGQFDQPAASAAELMMLKDGGGTIAMVTTTGATYETFNDPMNEDFLTGQFTKNSNGLWNAFGDAWRITKNFAYTSSATVGAVNQQELSNFRKFVLLGDPALTPDFPKYNVKLDSVVDGFSLQKADSVKALGKYVIYGSVRDLSGNTMTGFNGLLNISFFDKPSGIDVQTDNCGVILVNTQLNLIYKGAVSVTNGLYSLSFIAPKDINYYFSSGKISTYAQNGVTDAAGCDTSITVGGFSANPVVNTTPPVVRAYINDSLFRNGGITGNNTSLYVILNSETGINVSGYSIGHNLTGILDGNLESPYILNNYYQTAPNTYQLGYVNFPIQGLADGKHSIKVTAYDVNNNSGESTVDFWVVDSSVVGIQNLGNYPNPFDNLTHFVFEHNHPDELLNVQISIYNTAGVHVRTITESFTSPDSRSSDITWDGTDMHGSRLPSGVYVYKLLITTDKGYKSTAYQKLVIVR